MSSVKTHRDEFVRLARNNDKAGCLEYINLHDDFYDAMVNNYNWTDVLQEVCKYKLAEVATALIDKKCYLAHQDKWGYTAIMYACCNDLNDIVTYIIDKSTTIMTRSTDQGVSEIMYLCMCDDENNVMKMMDHGYDIYHKSHRNESLFTVAIKRNSKQIVKKLIDIDTDFIEQFNTLYHTHDRKKGDFYNDIAKYCVGKRNAYKHEIIATMNDASSTNMLYRSFHTTYAVQLVDIICDFLILPVIKS
ncbi:MAG: hypothetical protein Faunusvirus13_14 [Faunusvirus sp.]|jgi:hypothetical protein|uniref:Uncharacterized protein n=1 Tax=Faunusvirus sp. TaxID=2487766 RepID=A0A3G4ZZI7_9VIRU|nr:MAG: hypothetical protein Faunusvirus13_14 [Faunusvirus sp.]